METLTATATTIQQGQCSVFEARPDARVPMRCTGAATKQVVTSYGVAVYCDNHDREPIVGSERSLWSRLVARFRTQTPSNLA